MDESRAALALRTPAEASTVRFTEMVRAVGLDPALDFQNADLSGTDLRGEDLRKFDFRNASFRGALVQGALFNRTVKPRQLELATKGSRASVTLIGRQIAAARPELSQAMGPNLTVLDSISKATQSVPYDRERRIVERGTFLHDSSDLAGRRLAGPFKDHTRTIVHSDSAIILFEPESIFDFDTLSVALRYFSQRVVRPIVFVLENHLESDGASATLIQQRLGEWPPDIFVRFPVPEDAGKLTLVASREQVTRFLRLASGSTLMTTRVGSTAGSNVEGGSDTQVIQGHLGDRRGLVSAIEADVPYVYNRALRRFHVLLRDELYDRAVAEQLMKSLGSSGGHTSLAVFKAKAKSNPDFYVTVGVPSSPVWDYLER